MLARIALPLFTAFLPIAAVADHWTRSYPVTGKPALRIDTDDGAVVVRAGNANTIEAHVTTTGWHVGSDEVRVTDHHTGDRVDIEVRIPKHMFSVGQRSVRVEISVPREATADVRTGDGSITIESLKGEARLRTGDGSVHVDAFDGSLSARTGDGRIEFRGRFDALSAETADGSVSGEILAGSKLAASWRIETGDGSIKLGIPADLAADLDVRTGDGRIHSDLTVSGSSSGSSLRGKLNGGGLSLTVRTHDGSVHLKRQ
jgi:hypothetical protein